MVPTIQKPTIWKLDHLKTEPRSTIQKPDMSGFWIPTVRTVQLVNRKCFVWRGTYIGQSCSKVFYIFVNVAIVLEEPFCGDGWRLILSFDALRLGLELKPEVFVDHRTETLDQFN